MPIPTFSVSSGQYAFAASQGKLFYGGTLIAGVAIPVMAATLASKFTLWNPPGSGVTVEIVDFACGIDSATVVVNGLGWVILPHVSTQSAGVPTSPTIAAGASNVTTGLSSSTGGVNTSGAAS